MPTPGTSIQRSIGYPRHSNQTNKLKKKLKVFKLERKMGTICKWHDTNDGEDCEQEEKGTTEDEMAGWYHWLDGHGFG